MLLVSSPCPGAHRNATAMTAEKLTSSVFIIQRIIPHYRLGVFEHLTACDAPEVTIVTGDRSVDGVQAMSGAALDRIRTRIAQVNHLRIGSLTFSWQPEAWRLVRRERPDMVVVHGGFYDLTSWALLLWGRLRGMTVISWTIGLQRPERGPKLWARLVFYKLARGLLVYGDYPIRLLQEAGIAQDKMHVIYNSLDISEQRKAESLTTESDVARLRDELDLDESARVLIFIGRVVPRKRLSIAVEAISRLAGADANVHLVILGDGDDRQNLARLASDLRVQNRVHFIGAVFEERAIAAYMRLADAAIIPEAGLPIIHPMGYGVPPIISDDIHRHGTEWEAVEEGYTGYFYRDGDVADLARVIRRCLDNEPQRRAVALNCRKRVEERYTSEGHGARILDGVRRFSRSPGDEGAQID